MINVRCQFGHSVYWPREGGESEWERGRVKLRERETKNR